MDKVEVIVFTNMGRSYSFKNISNFEPTTQGFKLEYVGKATGVKRYAEFNNTCVAGYAIANQEEE